MEGLLQLIFSVFSWRSSSATRYLEGVNGFRHALPPEANARGAPRDQGDLWPPSLAGKLPEAAASRSEPPGVHRLEGAPGYGIADVSSVPPPARPLPHLDHPSRDCLAYISTASTRPESVAAFLAAPSSGNRLEMYEVSCSSGDQCYRIRRGT
jgi:hypothetical protein